MTSRKRAWYLGWVNVLFSPIVIFVLGDLYVGLFFVVVGICMLRFSRLG